MYITGQAAIVTVSALVVVSILVEFTATCGAVRNVFVATASTFVLATVHFGAVTVLAVFRISDKSHLSAFLPHVLVSI